MEQDRGDKYGPRIFPKNPWLPDVKLEGDIRTTSIFQRDTSYPPIFAKNSWTRGVLEKDTQMYFKPSETIGASYTPTAQTLRIQDMPRRKKKINPSPLGEDGKLQYPPKKSRKQLEEERKQLDMKMKPEKMDTGLVDLEDLLSGEYHRRQKKQKLLKQKEKKMINKFELLKWEGFTVERAKLEKLQAILPKHPDEQKSILYLQTSIEMDQVVKQKDLQRMIYYLTEFFIASDGAYSVSKTYDELIECFGHVKTLFLKSLNKPD